MKVLTLIPLYIRIKIKLVEVNYIFYFLLLAQQPPPIGARASSFMKFLDHTQRRTTVGRTPLDE